MNDDPNWVDATEDVPPAQGGAVRVKTLKWKKVLSTRNGKIVPIGYETDIPSFLYERIYKQPDGTWQGRGDTWGSRVSYPDLMTAINTIQKKFEKRCMELFLEPIK